jgi:thiosulfate dehydrogenase [quinone] large subunit
VTEIPSNSTNSKSISDASWAFLTLRLFLAIRWLIAGIQKFELNGSYSFANYYENMRRMGSGIAGSTFLPEWMCLPYAYTIGHLMVVLGVMLLLGIKTRIVLLLSSALYISLALGLMAAEEDGGVAWLAIHVGLTAAALLLVRHNRFAITRD